MLENVSVNQNEMAQLFVKSPEELQRDAAFLSPEQIALLIAFLYENEVDKGQKKMNALLVGMPHEHFEKFLLAAAPSILAHIQQESFGEPLQHQLTLTCHQQKKAVLGIMDHIEIVENEIKTFSPEHFSQELLEMVLGSIKYIRSQIEQYFLLTKRALQLSWNTNRIDLITKLGQEKENWEKMLKMLIGYPRTLVSDPTGLYLILEKQLNFIYGKDNDGDKDIALLRDDDPAIEGLFNLNCWSPQDYWRLGLLPQVSDESKLNHLPANEQEEILNSVQKNLNRIGLNTIRDLKYYQIYTHNALIEFITKHKEL